MSDYAPRSPDLSGLRSPPNESQEPFSYDYPPPPPIRNESFNIGSSSYYQPPSLPHQQSSTAFSHSSYDPPFPKLESQPSWNSQADPPPAPQPRRPGRPKREQSTQDAFNPDGTPQTQTKTRKPSMKKERPPPPEPEPRLPAPGDNEGIVVKTKFPVARIKRIVQADEEVGKVATGTPVTVGKALELFMIQMTLAAVAEASERGVKRLTAQNIKAAINKDDKFDFLKDIGDKIPDAHSGRGEGKGRAAKMERGTSEEDVDMDDGEQESPKSVKKRPGRKRRLDD